MPRNMRIIVVAFALSLLGNAAYAAGSVKSLLEIYDSGLAKDVIEAEIEAIQVGMLTANGYLETYRKEPPMYCQPDKLTLTGPMLIDMLRRAIHDDPKIGEADPALAILIVLRKTFPCS